ncbi:3634_t:CDS:2 [Ambispora gerdemannii]|uniref:3634_t:CDS:1 n=1 Tax=Ambispora gerdemannii TaxID=144530 RepID=A0A9N9ABV3_9GLOM|nr:3634_t:CDS:2 [Ambispora gerdemannii]
MRTIAPSKKGHIMPEVKVRFPPEVTPMNLIENAVAKLETSGQTSRIPNAFIAYRMAFCKELRLIQHPVITQPQLSALVKQSWLKEEENVRREYQRIAKEAKDLYIQICHERSPLFVANAFSINDEDSSPNTKNNSGKLELVFSNSSNLSDSNFDFVNNNEISSSKQSVTINPQPDSQEKTPASTPNITNIFTTDAPILENDNYFSLDLNLDTQFIDNLTPELLTSQALFSSILSIQSDFPSVPTGYNKCCKEKVRVLENRIVELEKKIESLIKLYYMHFYYA